MAALGFVGNRESLCPLCGDLCLVDTRLYPVEEAQVLAHGVAEVPASRSGHVWAHLSCAERLGLVRKVQAVCKHWRRAGRCAYGDKCQFRHPVETAPVAPKRTWGGRRVAVRNASRAAVLARFLVETYGLDRLRQGAGVLDVAGGQGALGFLLANLFDVPTTVVDPRKPVLASWAAKFRKGLFHRNVVANADNVARSRNDALRPVGHVGLYMDDATLEALSGPGIAQDALDGLLESAQGLVWTPKGLCGGGPGGDGVEKGGDEDDEVGHGDDDDDDDGGDGDGDEAEAGVDAVAKRKAEQAAGLWEACRDADEANRRLREFSVAVGMHPDQATEAIVDLALQSGRPFAVVPCCVYSKLFPRRKLRDGRAVRSYDDLIEYLLEKDPRVRSMALDFEGRNQVVFLPAEAAG